MKLTYREIESFVTAPNKAARVILVYGPDSGLIAERTQIMGKTVTPDLNDPFNVCTLDGNALIDDPARLSDEANAISMMGGDRLIIVQNAEDKITTVIKTYLENPSPASLVILRAGELGTKSNLRALCEKAKNAAAVPCYVEDERDLSRFIENTIRIENKKINRDALSWLCVNISGDRRKVRSEIEKLIIYKGNEESAISLEDAQIACGQSGAQNYDKLVYATANKNTAAALTAYQTLIEEGESEVGILRVLQNHFRRLHFVQAKLANDEPLDLILKNLHPPLFFKYTDDFKSQLRTWSLSNLNSLIMKLGDIEAQCKQTATPSQTLCAQTILGITKTKT